MKKKSLLFISIIIVALAIIGAMVYINMNSGDNMGGIRYTPDSQEPWNESLEGDNNSDGIKIPGFGKLYFPSGTKKVQMTLANPSDNDCYFIYTLHLNDPDGEIIYTSDKVAPGMALYDLTIIRPLDVGEYTLYVHVATYSSDDKQLNGALLKAPLTVMGN